MVHNSMTEEIPPQVPIGLLLHKVLITDSFLLLRGDPRYDGDLSACGVTVSALGHLEEGVDFEVVNLVDDLIGLNEVAPHPPIFQESQPTLLQFLLVSAV